MKKLLTVAVAAFAFQALAEAPKAVETKPADPKAVAAPMKDEKTPAKAEPVKVEPLKAEPVKAEPVKAEPMKHEGAKHETAKPEKPSEKPAKK